MDNVFQTLNSLNIDYELHEHPAVFTCEEADKHYQNIEGARSKNLFLRNKKGNQEYLVVTLASKTVDLKKLKDKLNESGLSFASDERLMKSLGLTKGSVSPFGLINNTEKNVIVVIDEDLLASEKQHFHPNLNVATVVLSTEDFKKYLNSTGNQILYIKI